MGEQNSIKEFKELIAQKRYREAREKLEEIKKKYDIENIDFYEALIDIELGKEKEAIELLRKEKEKGNNEAGKVLITLKRKPIGTIFIIIIFFLSFILINNGQKLKFIQLLKYGFYHGAGLSNLITSLFVHYSVFHFIFNSIALLFFGPLLEKEIGTNKALFIFFISGIIGNLIQGLIPNVIVIGASGAIFGVIGSFLIINPLENIYLLNILPIKTVILFTAYFLVTCFIQSSRVAEISHFIGFLTGQIISVILSYRYRNNFYLWTSIYIGLWNIIKGIEILEPISIIYIITGTILFYFGWNYFRYENKKSQEK